MEAIIIVIIGALLIGTTGLAWFLARRANHAHDRILIEGLRDIQCSLDAANESLNAANESLNAANETLRATNESLRVTLEESQVNGK